jgi:hypothetical protein
MSSSKKSSRNDASHAAGAIGKEAAERVREAAWHETDVPAHASSHLLRAREMPAFVIGDNRVDVRGWPVYSCDAQLVGRVDALYVDMRSNVVRYLGIALADEDTGVRTGSVLVPVGATARPGDRHVVVLSTISSSQLTAAPRVMRRPITRSDEDAVLAAYGIATSRDIGGRDLYSMPAFSGTRLFG